MGVGQAARLEGVAEQSAEGEAARGSALSFEMKSEWPGKRSLEVLLLPLELPGLQKRVRHGVVMDDSRRSALSSLMRAARLYSPAVGGSVLTMRTVRPKPAALRTLSICWASRRLKSYRWSRARSWRPAHRGCDRRPRPSGRPRDRRPEGAGGGRGCAPAATAPPQNRSRASKTAHPTRRGFISGTSSFTHGFTRIFGLDQFLVSTIAGRWDAIDR